MKLVDIPGGRKIHKTNKPFFGGIPILASVVVAILACTSILSIERNQYLFGALFLVFVLGIIDDLRPLRSSGKLIGQFIAGLILFLLFDLRLVSFYGFINTSDFGIELSFTITVFTIIVITNAYNLIDGVDGLAGSLGLVIITFFGVWFNLVGETSLGLLCFALCGSLLAFLYFNWPPSRIFMGDSGSSVIGLFIAVCVIYFININHQLGDLESYKFHSSVGTGICILFLPLFDSARIFLVRLMSGKSPLSPDNRHIHHILIKGGLKHGQVTLILLSIQFLIIALAILLYTSEDVTLLAVIIICSALLSYILHNLNNRTSNVNHKSSQNPESIDVVPVKKSA